MAHVWSLDSISSLAGFGNITKDAYGANNRDFVLDPAGGNSTVLRVKYPAGSYTPSATPVGGTGFYATPIDLSKASSVTLEFQVYFPVGFDFVKGGKLPGLYGGSLSCSGGNEATDCFSTRFVFRTNGSGEIYLYVDQRNQVPAFCKIPPLTTCNPSFGVSVGRGSFTFITGQWTKLVQTITLNTPNKTDGKLLVATNDKTVISFSQVNWRNRPEIGFAGLVFSTFFGGSDVSWATPVEQFTYFKGFKLSTQ